MMALQPLDDGRWRVIVMNEDETWPACEQTLPTLREAREHGEKYIRWRASMDLEAGR